jgi:hypothetical protein
MVDGINDVPATRQQLWKIHQLTGENTKNLKITYRQASTRIQKLELDAIQSELTEQSNLDDDPFSEAHCCVVEGDQRSGKSIYAVGKVFERYYKDAARIYCEDVLKITCEIKAYYRKDRVTKIKHNGQLKYVVIPKDYELKSPIRIFSNIHLYGVPYVYIPSYHHMLAWLKNGIICNGWLIMDEAHRGISARATQTAEGREWVGELYQLGKSKLEVMMITHQARMVDFLARLIPTKRVHCTYNPKTFRVTYTLKQKGEEGEEEHSFDARQYFGCYRTNEKVNA